MWLASNSQADKARRVRRGFPIHCYVGKNGSGKTLHAVYDTLPTLEEGRVVLSTVRLLDYTDPRPCDGWETGWEALGLPAQRCPIVDHISGDHLDDGHGQAHPLYIRFTNWRQFLEFERGDVLMDEITGVADSQDHHGLPPEIRNKFPQLRRADVAVRITGLAWSRLNKRLRESCQAVTRCKGWMPVPRSSEFAADRIFRPKRLSMSATYDCLELPVDDISEHAFKEAEVIKRGRLWIPGSTASQAYATFDSVDVVGYVDLSGTCGYCGGSRTRPKCQCADYVAEIESRKSGPAGGGSEAPPPAGHGPGDLIPVTALHGRVGRGRHASR
ncbi:hypothetical protein ACWGRN_29915 [Streptomyces albidoflavus]